MITELFDDTEKDWSAILACVKILVRDGHPIKISKEKDWFLLQYTYENNETLEWVDENHYVGKRDTNDPGDLSAIGGF